MTSYPRIDSGREWEARPPRKWLYQTPAEILIKASNGASDFGNKFGQPLICGSLQTLEHTEQDPDGSERKYGYDKVVMLAGGVGYAKKAARRETTLSSWEATTTASAWAEEQYPPSPQENMPIQ